MRAAKVSGPLVLALLAALAPLLLSPPVQAAGDVTISGGVVPVAPVRVLDTRSGTGAPKHSVAKGASVSFTVLGKGAVPGSGVSGVFINVTATGATGSGYVTAHAAGTGVPDASNLAVRAGQTIPNLVLVPVGSDGRVSLYNGTTGTIQLVADTAGYVLAGTATAPGSAVAVAPSRVLDTRNAVGAPRAAVPAHSFVEVVVAGRGGVPGSGVSGVWLNVTVTRPAANGFIAVSPGGSASTSSNLNFSTGQTIPNLVFVPLGPGGSPSKVRLYNGAAGSVELIADTAGYVRAGTAVAPGAASPVTPARILDTRRRAAVPGHGGFSLQVTGHDNIPDADQVAGVFLNITVTRPAGRGYVSVFPDGLPTPTSSNLNFVAGQTIPNLVFVPVNRAGRIRLYNGSPGSVHLLADTAGYVRREESSLLTTIGTSADAYELDTSTHGEAVTWTNATCAGTQCRRAADRTVTTTISYADRVTRTTQVVARATNISGSTTSTYLGIPRIGGPGRFVVLGRDVVQPSASTSALLLWDAGTAATRTIPTPNVRSITGYDISGNGAWIVYSGLDDSGRTGIWAYNRTDPRTVRVLNKPDSGAGAAHPRLESVSADGSWITFSNNDCSVSCDSRAVLEVIKRDGSGRTTVFADTASVAADPRSSTVTRDGQRIVFSTSSASSDVVRMWNRGSGVSAITRDGSGALAWRPSMSDDGAWVAFSEQASDGYGVFLRNTATGARYVVDNVGGWPVLSGAGDYVAMKRWRGSGVEINLWGPNPN